MIIVFDTNIWISELGLNSPLGAAVRFYVEKNKAQVAIPEVIRLETQHVLRNRLKKSISDIEKNYSQLLAVFKKLKSIVLPNDDEVEKKVAEVFLDLGIPLIDVPFCIESARSSLMKTIEKVPPSGEKNQQFKDGVLWADCVDLMKQDDIILVTEDRDFYEEHNYDKGLAKNLLEEIIDQKHTFKILSSLFLLLEDIKVDFSINEDMLEEKFLAYVSDSVNEMLTRGGFKIGNRMSRSKTIYATENPQLLYIEFSIQYRCVDLTTKARDFGILTVRGDASYDSKLGIFEKFRSFGEQLSYKNEDGSEERIQNYVLFADGGTIGHKEVINTIRYRID